MDATSEGRQPIRVLFITRSHGERGGGMERFSFELIRELQQNTALSTTVLAHRGTRRTSPLFALTVIPKALQAVRTADVVNLGDPMLSLCGWVIKTLAKKPVAVSVHGLDILYPNLIYQTYLKLFFGRFDAYLPISKYVNNLLAHRVARAKVRILNPGVHDRHYNPAITRRQLETLVRSKAPQLPAHAVFLFTSGRLTRRKGHAWFVANVLPQLPDRVVYLIAGTGREQQAILTAAEAANVQGRVIMLGRVAEKDLAILYNTVDAFIQPNIRVENDVEGFGLVMLEAALCERPVLAANIEGLTDAIQDGRNGQLLPAGDAAAWVDAVRYVIDRPHRSPQARQYTLDNFLWPKISTKYAAALSALKLPATPPS